MSGACVSNKIVPVCPYGVPVTYDCWCSKVYSGNSNLVCNLNANLPVCPDSSSNLNTMMNACNCGSQVLIQGFGACVKNAIVVNCPNSQVSSSCWCGNAVISSGSCNSTPVKTDNTLSTCSNNTLATTSCNCGSSVVPSNLGACVNSNVIPVCLSNIVTAYNCWCGTSVVNAGNKCTATNNIPTCPDSQPFNGSLCQCGNATITGGLFICIKNTV